MIEGDRYNNYIDCHIHRKAEKTKKRDTKRVRKTDRVKVIKTYE